MNGRYFGLFIVLLLAISLSSATHTGSHGTLPIDIGEGGDILICQEDWSGSGWGNCINGNQTFICFDKNICGTTDLIPANCLETRVCGEEPTGNTTTPPSNGDSGDSGGSSGGGGGGSSSSNTQFLSDSSRNSGSCTEKWGCEEWSNEEDNCGTRVCEDINSCGTAQLKPETERLCPSTGFSSFFSGITGAVTGFAKSGVGMVSLSFVLLIIAGVGIVIFLRRGSLAK